MGCADECAGPGVRSHGRLTDYVRLGISIPFTTAAR